MTAKPFNVAPQLRIARSAPGTWVVVTHPLATKRSAETRCGMIRVADVYYAGKTELWYGMEVSVANIQQYGWCVIARLPDKSTPPPKPGPGQERLPIKDNDA